MEAEADKPRYTYDPLPQDGEDWIRLLRLLPGQWSDPLVCVLSAHRREDIDGRYLALSYVWGGRTEDRFLGIKSSPEEVGTGERYEQPTTPAALPITDNLFSALRRIRDLFDAHTPVWADAVCINQDDNAEKSRQVARMSEIFRDGDEIFCWLGEKNDETNFDLRLLNEIDEGFWKTHRGECDDHYEAFDGEDDRDDWMNHVVFDPRGEMSYEKDWNAFVQVWHEKNPLYTSALLHLACNQYFTRQWIQQEVCLGWEFARVYLGDQRINLYCLDRHIKALEEFLSSLEPGPSSLAFWTDVETFKRQIHKLQNTATFLSNGLPAASESHDLCDWLEFCNGLGCDVAQDKIFGLLSVSREGPSLKQRFDWPNYDLSPQTVYIQAATYLVESIYAPGMLLTDAFHVGKMEGLPSWVPDWSRPTNAVIRIRSRLNWHPRTKPSTIRVTQDDGGHFLHIPGLKFIHNVSTSNYAIPRDSLDDTSFDHEKASKLWGILRCWWDHVSQAFPDGHYEAGEKSLEQAFMDLLTNERSEIEYDSEPMELLCDPSLKVGEYPRVIEGWLEDMWKSCHGLDIAVFDQRYIGLVPEETMAGDVVTILSGGEGLFVLRPIPSKSRYQLMGFAQVEGLMEDGVLGLDPSSRVPKKKQRPWMKATIYQDKNRKFLLPEMFVLE